MNFVDFVIIVGVPLIGIFHIMLHKKRSGLSLAMLYLKHFRVSLMTLIDATVLAMFIRLAYCLMFHYQAALPKGVLLGYVIAVALVDVLIIKFNSNKNKDSNKNKE